MCDVGSINEANVTDNSMVHKIEPLINDTSHFGICFIVERIYTRETKTHYTHLHTVKFHTGHIKLMLYQIAKA